MGPRSDRVRYAVAREGRSAGGAAPAAAYGAAPNRLGVMLFYLLPASFCDVSDGWRLPQPRQRVHVVMAGIAVQWMIAGTSALMNHVDASHLRDKAIADARGWTLRPLLGAKLPPRQLPQFRWAIPFGIGCMIFPLVIVANALLIWSSTLQRIGPVGSGIILLAFAAALFGLGKELFSGFSWKGLSSAVRVRAIGFVTLVAASAVVTLAAIPVPQTLVGGFTALTSGCTPSRVTRVSVCSATTPCG